MPISVSISPSAPGLSTFTRDLDAVPLIAPEYFARHYPALYAKQRIWYIGFVAVAAPARNSDAFRELFAEYYRTAAAENGVVFLDICAYNEDIHRLPRAIELTLRRMSGGASRSQRIDAQTFWGHDVNGVNFR